MCHIGYRTYIGHFHLRICHYFQEYATGVGINRLLEGRYIRKVAKFRTHPESPEHVREQ